ncbi:hypothetical protein RUM44_010564 [Polyplax serrata]|uniref:Uncharacterized protein n=1 Tax=Polyplax serrata TaxID=468196 RepID=A0ABR1AXQ2_POLSC
MAKQQKAKDSKRERKTERCDSGVDQKETKKQRGRGKSTVEAKNGGKYRGTFPRVSRDAFHEKTPLTSSGQNQQFSHLFYPSAKHVSEFVSRMGVEEFPSLSQNHRSKARPFIFSLPRF